MLLAQACAICPICGEADALTAKPLSGEGRHVGYCGDCIDVAAAVGIGDTDTAAIHDFIEKNLP